jgi:hypothetical protein
MWISGRRIESQNPGEYRATRSSRQPVIVENNWQEPTVEEQLKHDTVHKLETHLAEVKAVQKEKIHTVSVNTNRRLYQQPDMVSNSTLDFYLFSPFTIVNRKLDYISIIIYYL